MCYESSDAIEKVEKVRKNLRLYSSWRKNDYEKGKFDWVEKKLNLYYCISNNISKDMNYIYLIPVHNNAISGWSFNQSFDAFKIWRWEKRFDWEKPAWEFGTYIWGNTYWILFSIKYKEWNENEKQRGRAVSWKSGEQGRVSQDLLIWWLIIWIRRLKLGRWLAIPITA